MVRNMSCGNKHYHKTEKKDGNNHFLATFADFLVIVFERIRNHLAKWALL